MACPHCGEHLLHKRDGALHCCRCGRQRLDLAPGPGLFHLRAHGLVITAGALCLPLALGMALLDGLRLPSSQAAQDRPAGQLQARNGMALASRPEP